MQKAQEPAAEAVAQRHAGFGFKGEGSVVHAQLFQSILQVFVIGAVGGINAAEHHRLHFLVAGQGRRCGGGGVGDGIAHTGVPHVLDGGGNVAHVPGQKFLAGSVGGGEGAHFHHVKLGSRLHHAHAHAGVCPAVDHTDEADGTPVIIICGVKNKRLQGLVFIAFGGRHLGDDGFQYVFNADAYLGGDEGGIGGVQADIFLNFGLGFLRLGRGQVDLIDNRHRFQIVFQCHIHISQGLGFHTLGGVHHKEGPFAGGQGPAHFVGKVHMAGSVNEVEGVFFAVLGGIVHAHGLGFDGDAPLPFQLHGVQNLLGHLPLFKHARLFQDAVRQSGLAVVNMGNNAKISNVVQTVISHRKFLLHS